MSYSAGASGLRVLFVVPKSVGPAVRRNRARRRVREALRELESGEGAGALGVGEYRLSVFAPLESLSATELRTAVSELLSEVRP